MNASQTNPPTGGRDLLHRAIYDYFRWCFKHPAECQTREFKSPPQLVAGRMAVLDDVFDGDGNKALDNETNGNWEARVTARGQHQNSAADENAAIEKTSLSELAAAANGINNAESKEGTSLFAGTTNLENTGAFGSLETQQHTEMPNAESAWTQKIQRVLHVLEQEFPEILFLPAEKVEGKALPELEMQFTRCPPMDSCVRGREVPAYVLSPVLRTTPLDGVAATACALPPNPPLPGETTTTTTTTAATAAMPTILPPQTPLQNTTTVATDFTAMEAGDNHLGAQVDVDAPVAAHGAIAGDTNEKKRKAPLVDETPHIVVTKKLKEQEQQIKSLKTQLKATKGKIDKLKRAKSATSEVISKKQARKTGITELTFEERFEQLSHFAQGYGHCRVPCTSQENPGLARWVQSLRTAYKEKQKRGEAYVGQLTDERMKKLEEIGFEWSLQAPKISWEERLEQLKEFKNINGHCRIVRSYPENPSLGEWCHRQRFLAHKNQLGKDRVKKLSDLGFEIWIRRQGKSWDDHFKMLLAFRRQHKHLKVPPPDSRTKMKQVIAKVSDAGDSNDSETQNQDIGRELPGLDGLTEEYKEEQAFHRWVLAQRDNYHLKFQKGIKCTLTKTRVKKLESIGFDWKREGGENDLRKIRTGALHHRNDPEVWNRRFNELLDYKKRFGDCNIPKEWPENKSLGAWVSTQRKGYKAMLAGERSSMTPERQMALDSIGFTWNLRPARTRPKILEIGGLQNPGISQV